MAAPVELATLPPGPLRRIGRQSGKTFALAMRRRTRGSRPGRQILIVSAGDEATKDLLAQISQFAQSPLSAGTVVDDQHHPITLSNGKTIRSVPASEKQIRGRAIDLLIFDEACYLRKKSGPGEVHDHRPAWPRGDHVADPLGSSGPFPPWRTGPGPVVRPLCQRPLAVHRQTSGRRRAGAALAGIVG